jgi:hypothetical protein
VGSAPSRHTWKSNKGVVSKLDMSIEATTTRQDQVELRHTRKAAKAGLRTALETVALYQLGKKAQKIERPRTPRGERRVQCVQCKEWPLKKETRLTPSGKRRCNDCVKKNESKKLFRRFPLATARLEKEDPQTIENFVAELVGKKDPLTAGKLLEKIRGTRI